MKNTLNSIKCRYVYYLYSGISIHNSAEKDYRKEADAKAKAKAKAKAGAKAKVKAETEAEAFASQALPEVC